MPGSGLGTEAAGDLLLGFRWAQVAFGLVARGRDRQVGQEAQYVGVAVAVAFQQQPPGPQGAERVRGLAGPGRVRV